MPPALFPALALIAGAVVGTSLDCSLRLSIPILPVICAGAAISWWREYPRSACALCLAGFGLASAILAADARERALHPSLRTVLDKSVGSFLIETLGPEPDHAPILIRALLSEDAAVHEDYVSLRADVVGLEQAGQWTDVSGGVTLTVSGEAASTHASEWRAGRVIEAPATFRRPARYLNDGVADFERELALGGTTLFGSIKSGLLIHVMGRGSTFQEWASNVRAHVRASVARWVAPHDPVAAAIVTAVLIGDRTGLPDDVTDRLQRAGTYHVIAISGGNIAVLAGLVFGLLALSGLRARARAVIAIVALVAYSEVATTGPSVWRATMMAVIYLVARLFDHRAPSWQATALAAGVMAVVTPLDVRSAGFVLTFGATAALLESARWIRVVWRRSETDSSPWRRAAGWLFASILASLAVELALTPVAATSFSRITLAGPLLNLLAVPLMAVAQVAGLAVAAFDTWSSVARAAGWLAAVSATGIVRTATLVDLSPAFAWRVPPPGISLLGTYYASMLIAAFASRLRFRFAAMTVLAAAFLLIAGVVRSRDARAVTGVRLTVLDVGQGEALMLESDAARLQIDAGGVPFGSGGFDVGARVVAPALWARGIYRLDALLLTHGDPDHIGGAPVLLDTFRPHALWEGVIVPRHAPSRQVRDRATAAHIGLAVRRAGESFHVGHAHVRVLHPPEPDWERPRVRNDDSVVLEVTCGDVAILLTGDISGEVERDVAPQLTPARIRILKVAHHGSRTSSSATLLESWRPQIALISAGRGNTFGHPAPEVLQRLGAIGARIYRTDRDGQITVDSDCRSVVVRTFNGGKA